RAARPRRQVVPDLRRDRRDPGDPHRPRPAVLLTGSPGPPAGGRTRPCSAAGTPELSVAALHRTGGGRARAIARPPPRSFLDKPTTGTGYSQLWTVSPHSR